MLTVIHQFEASDAVVDLKIKHANDEDIWLERVGKIVETGLPMRNYLESLGSTDLKHRVIIEVTREPEEADPSDEDDEL